MSLENWEKCLLVKLSKTATLDLKNEVFYEKKILVGKKELNSLGRKPLHLAVTTKKCQMKENWVEMVYLTGGILVSVSSSLGWTSSGLELTLFWHLCSPGKYGILTHSLSSSRPNAVVYSN